MKRREVLGLLGLALLAGCGGGFRGLSDQGWSSTLSELEAMQQRREVGTVQGFLYLREPVVPTPLFNRPVILIPLPASIERLVTDAHTRYAADGFQPLSAKDFAKVHAPIDAYLRELRAGSHRQLVREVKTASSTDPLFRFQDVAPGRWLLLAELSSSLSTLLWAVPVTVSTGSVSHQSLNDQSVWLEGLKR